MSYLFLSYSKRDKNFAQNISDLLEKAGFSVWMDENPRELTAQDWPIIEANIRNAAALVLLVSESVKQSAWIKRELDFAEEIQKPIVPILIEGKGWSRLTMPLEILELGLNLSLPDSLWIKLKALQDSPLPVELPPQIPRKAINPKRERAKQSFLLWLGIMAFLLILLLIFVPPVLENFNSRATATSIVQAQIASASAEYHLTASKSLEETGTAEAERIRRSESERATDIRETATARSMDSLAATETASAEYLAATLTREANLNLTAVRGNGQLPCDARLVAEEGRFNVYRRPSNDSSPTTVRLSEGEERYFIVREWIVNDDGVWYRFGTETQHLMGYLRAENLQLDDACPR